MAYGDSTHEPGEPGIAVPFGSAGGASFSWEYAPETGISDADTTSRIKDAGLMVDDFTEFVDLEKSATTSRRSGTPRS